MRRLVLSAIVLAGSTGGCGSPDLAGALGHENPSVRAEACLRAAKVRDPSLLPLLVERLDDPAADVRFFAIEAIRRITGQTLGYRYYASPPERYQAMGRWREWLRASPAERERLQKQAVTTLTASAPAPPSAAGEGG